ncbi:MAG: hypothetical protein JNL01_02490 [Bdellovibrionales bacterium]|nr:hypothetical protein [Bdellovibrionales bacterium]
MKKKTPASKYPDHLVYRLYEAAVQSAEVHARWFDEVYGEINGTTPNLLREDFCGTFQISREWVKLRPKNFAMGLDLDPKVLEAGQAFAKESLRAEEFQRLLLLKKNVVSETRPKSDIVIACNYSFFIIQDRKKLIQYFKKVRKSLARRGLFFLEMAGGPGMQEQVRETKVIKGIPLGTGRGTKKASAIYFWDQKSFDPITRNGKYAIDFRLSDGKWYRNAFTYDWRLWTIPELKDALTEAGFSKVRVYWETAHRGVGTGEYLETQSGDNAWSWIAYLAASC